MTPRLSVDVPQGLLEVPYLYERKRILRFESGVVLDLQLRRLSRVSGAVDRALAWRLARLQAARGYVRLGYAKLGDYARERLDLAERTAFDLSRLGRSLATLHRVDAALAAGELSWTAALEVTRVAGVEDQDAWVDTARRLSVRALKRRVREALARPGVGKCAEGEDRRGAARETTSIHGAVVPRGRPGHRQPEQSQENERSGVIEQVEPCGANGTVETGGPPRPDGQADPAGGEASGGGSTELATESRESGPRLGRLKMHTDTRTAFHWFAALDLCQQLAGADLPQAEAAEYVLADFVSGGALLPDDDDQPIYPLPRFRLPDSGRSRRRQIDDLERSDQLGPLALDRTQARELDTLVRIVEAEEVPSNPFELDASMRRLAGARRGLDLDLARLLRNFHSLGLARHVGFAGFEDYVRARLGISTRRARFLVQLDRRLYGWKAINRAVRDGRIGTVAASLVARVARDRRTEAIWIERAERVSVVRLRREVEWAERRRLLRQTRDLLPPPHGRLTDALDELTEELIGGRPALVEPGAGAGRQTFAATDDGVAQAGGAGMIDRRERGSSVDRNGGAGRQTFPGQGAGAQGVAVVPPLPLEAYRSPDVDLTLWLDEAVIPLWEQARRQITAHTGVWFLPNDLVLHWVALDFLATHLPLWLEALAREDPIAVRERFRCAVPGCTVRGGAGHHLIFLAHGGPDEPWNLSFLCYTHHLEGVHLGHLRVRGQAPDRLTFELGIKPDGSALETFVRGERVIRDDATGLGAERSVAM